MKRHLGTQEDLDEVKRLLREETESWRKDRLIALKLGFSSNNKAAEIAETVGSSRSSVQRWFAAHRDGGLEAALRRDYKPGQARVLDQDIEAFLLEGLKSARWTSATLAKRELEERFGRTFAYTTVYTWLKNCAGVMRVPRPAHERRDPQKAEAFKRSLLAILKALPLDWSKPRIVWFADESRYGLLPSLRKCWTLKGLRPVKRWLTRYQWSYCYGAIDPVQGRCVFVQTPSVSLEWTEAFLLEIRKAYPDHEHVVVWDGAGFHPRSSEHEKVPDGVHVVALPPYSPELNPIEKLWDCVQDFTSNKLWPSIERLDQVVGEILCDYRDDPRSVISLFGKGWIRASANASVPTDCLKPI